VDQWIFGWAFIRGHSCICFDSTYHCQF
jgi:hypothetical protein